MFSLRASVGAFWLLMAILFLACNSALMREGAMAFANTPQLKFILGAVAVSTPWILAVLPFQAGISMRPTYFGLRRPSAGTLVVAAAYGVFISYNVLNGSNALTGSRVAIVAEKQKGVDDVQRKRDKLTTLKAQLSSIPTFRPADTVWALIDAQRQDKRWKSTQECSNATAQASRTYCAGIKTLEAEAASAEQAANIQKQIDELDSKLESHEAVSEADPQAEAIARWAGVTPQDIRVGIGITGPIALEFGALVFLFFAGRSFGWSHSSIAPTGPTPLRTEPAGYIPSPAALRAPPETPLERLTAQRQLCETFFREWTRPVPAGAMAEGEWYQNYRAVCRRSNDEPLPVEAFRRIAQRFVPRITLLDGEYHYFELLPKIPEAA